MTGALLRLSRTLGFLLGGVSAAFVAAALFLLATWDGARVRNEFADALRIRTLREVGMDGPPRLRFLPGPTLVVSGLAIGEPGAPGVAARVGRLEAGLALWPLIAGRVEVERLRLIDADIRLGRRADGRLSLADLLDESDVHPWPARMRLRQIALERSRLRFSGEGGQDTYALERASLRIGPLIGGSRGYLSGEATLTHAPVSASGGIEFATGYRLDPDARSFDLDDLSLRFRGDAFGVTALDSELSAQEGRGDFANAISLTDLRLRAKGRAGARDLALSASLAALARQGNALALRAIRAQVALGGADDRFDLKLNLPAVAPRSESFPGEQLQVDFAASGEGRRTEGRVAARVAYRPELQRVVAENFDLSWLSKGGREADAPRAGVRGQLSGTLAIAPLNAVMEAQLRGQLAGSEMQLEFSRQPGRQPVWQFGLAADRFDAERLARALGAGDARTLAARFADYEAHGMARLETASLGGLRLTDLSARVESGGGRIAVEDMQAHGYGGDIAGRLDYVPSTRRLNVQQQWRGVGLASLAADQKRRVPLSGELDAQFAVSALTGSRAAFEQSLRGDFQASVRSGAWQGMDLADFLRSVRPALKDRGPAVRAAQGAERQSFERLDLACRIESGLAQCGEMAVDAGWLRLGGNAQFALADARLDWSGRMAVQSRGATPRDLLGLRGVTVPLRISGPVQRPQWRLDWQAAPPRAAPRPRPATPATPTPTDPAAPADPERAAG